MIKWQNKHLLFIKHSLVALGAVFLILFIVWMYLVVYFFPLMKGNIYASIEDQLKIITQDTIEDFASTEELLKNVSKGISPFLSNQTNELVNIFSNYDTIFDHYSVYNNEQEKIISFPSNEIKIINSKVRATLITERTTISNIYEIPNSNDKVYSILVPIYVNNHVEGVLVGSINIKNGAFNPSISNLRLRDSGFVFLINSSGEILTSGNRAYIGKNVNEIYTNIDLKESKIVEELTIGILQNLGKNEKIVSFSHISDDMIVGISYEYNELFAPILRLKQGYIYFASLLMIIIGSLIIYYNRKIHEPVLTVVEYAVKISNGVVGYSMVDEKQGELNYFVIALNKMLREKDYLLEQMIDSLVLTMEKKDSYTAGHSHRVTHYAVQIAKEMKLSEEEIKILSIGALLHDIGKIGIPDQVLTKPGKLTEVEFEKIKLHPVYGYEIIKEVKNFKETLPIIRSHHERFDGRGYPDQLKELEIPLLARITSVADAFDAMISNRSYRNKITIEQAVDIIRSESGRQFDPQVVEAFLQYRSERINEV